MANSTNNPLGTFERYLTLWVAACIAGGIAAGKAAPGFFQWVSSLEYAQVNWPVAVFVWLMIFPMMVQIDFSALRQAGGSLHGLGLTCGINWVVKPFTMAAIAALFFYHLYPETLLPPDTARQYLAGAILLGAAPCTAMVFVWSYLAGGNPLFTLVQVAVNDLIMLVAFIPIVGFLLGMSDIQIPYSTLFTSVLVFVVLPLLAGYLTNRTLRRSRGEAWFQAEFLPRLKPVSILALLTTLVLLFAFQGETILNRPLHIGLIALPLLVQSYLIFFITWGLGRLIRLPYGLCAPASFIATSNFFELAVAVAISLFGLESGAALATVVGVLIEVPVMLSLVALARRWQFG
jgi:ACR3 family arsenite transporter